MIIAPCKEAGANLKLEFEGTSLDMLREMIVMGFGAAFMPGLYVRRELETDPSVKCFVLKDRSIFSTIGMAWRSRSARGPEYFKLAEFLKMTLASHGAKP